MSPIAADASRHLRIGNPSTWWLLRLLCPRHGFEQFCLLYRYFRWADDIVDVPDRTGLGGFLARQETLIAGQLPPEPTAPEQALHAVDGMDSVITGMWSALRFDAGRSADPLDDTSLAEQIARVGDAYLGALWACAGGPAAPPADLVWLSRAATAAHMMRDCEEDLRLGYCNIPMSWVQGRPLTDLDVDAWRRERAVEVDAWFARGQRALAAVRPLRLRLLLGLYGRKYQRLARMLGATR